jgi:hypothetical protein
MLNKFFENNFSDKEIHRKDWSIIYSPEFEKYRDKYKDIISTIQKVLRGEKVEGISLEYFSQTSNNKNYFIIDIEGEKFFIKRIPEEHKQGGVNEFKAASEAKKRLEDSGIQKVSVVDYIFGYSGNGARYVVSSYDPRVTKTLASYMDKCWEEKRYEEFHALDHRFADLDKIFKDYYDFKVENMGYDEENDEIILFDLNSGENMLIESSDDEL